MTATMNATRRASTQYLGIVRRSGVIQIILSVFLLSGCLLFVGCFPMGLPEHFSELEKVSTPLSRSVPARSPQLAAPVAILIRPPFSTSDHTREIVGHQYLLGIFPVTRLYFEHSAADLLYELLLDELQLRGFTVYELPQEAQAVPNVLSGYEPVLHFTLNNFRVNAFDAIFLRILSVTGTLQGELIDNSSAAQTARARDVISLDEKTPKSQGHGPALLALAMKSIRVGINQALEELLPHAKRRTLSSPSPSADSPSLLVFNPPVIDYRGEPHGTFEQDLGATITASYGYGPEPAFSEKMLRRILQRGASQVALPGAQPLLPTSAISRLPHASNESAWSVDAHYRIVAPQVSEKLPLKITAHLTLREYPTSDRIESITPFAEAACTVAEPIPTDRDGYLVLALENAARKVTAAFLNGNARASENGSEPNAVLCEFVRKEVHD